VLCVHLQLTPLVQTISSLPVERTLVPEVVHKARDNIVARFDDQVQHEVSQRQIIGNSRHVRQALQEYFQSPRLAGVNHLAVARQDQDSVHQTEDVGPRLVNAQHHNHALGPQRREGLNHRGGVRAVQTRRGLVQK